jgi:phenylacetate-CoA ligase
MATMTDSTLSSLRERFGRALAARLPEHIGRLGWDARQLAGHQRGQLRALLACALERSPFHARRLAGIDPGRFEPGQLAGLPVMTKQQMMASFDELLTDRAVTRARAEQQLAAHAHEPGLLDGRYVCLA